MVVVVLVAPMAVAVIVALAHEEQVVVVVVVVVADLVAAVDHVDRGLVVAASLDDAVVVALACANVAGSCP